MATLSIHACCEVNRRENHPISQLIADSALFRLVENHAISIRSNSKLAGSAYDDFRTINNHVRQNARSKRFR